MVTKNAVFMRSVAFRKRLQLAILERILTLSGRKSKFFTNYCLKIARNRMKKAIIEWYNAFKMYNIVINIIEIRQNVSLL